MSIEMAALELFQNEKLLEQFSPMDIREIAYIAAWEMFLQEKETLQRLQINS